jgi:hypothetical protein
LRRGKKPAGWPVFLWVGITASPRLETTGEKPQVKGHPLAQGESRGFKPAFTSRGQRVALRQKL